MYQSLSEYENQLHEKNQKKIRVGIRCIIIIPMIFLILMFTTDSSKDIFLILWIVALFALSIYLIQVEYSDYKLQQKLSEIRGENAIIKPLIPDNISEVEAKLIKTIKKIDENMNSEEETEIHNKENEVKLLTSSKPEEEDNYAKHI